MNQKKTIKFFLSCSISLFFLYLAFRHVKFHELLRVFQTINYFWAIPFILLTILGMYIRAIRWRWILRSQYQFPSRDLFPSLMIGFALNSLLPLRAGEFARPYILAKRRKIPFTTVFATVVVERIVDSITLLFSFFMVLLFVKIDPQAQFNLTVSDSLSYTITGKMLGDLSRKFSGITFVLLVGIATLILDRPQRIYEFMIQHTPFLGTSLKKKITTIVHHFSQGFHSLKSPFSVVMIFFYSFVIWALVGLSLQIMSWGFASLSLNFYQGMAVMIIICIAILIPAAPGYWGLYECGGIFALIALGVVSKEEGQVTAAGFTLLIHSLQIIPIVLIGIYFLWKENISLKSIEASEEIRKGEGSPVDTI